MAKKIISVDELIDSLKDNEGFLDFLHKEYGMEDISSLTRYELYGFFYNFRSQQKFFNKHERKNVSGQLKHLEEKAWGFKNAVTEIYFPGQKFSKLSKGDQWFITAISAYLANEKNKITLEDLKKEQEKLKKERGELFKVRKLETADAKQSDLTVNEGIVAQKQQTNQIKTSDQPQAGKAPKSDSVNDVADAQIKANIADIKGIMDLKIQEKEKQEKEKQEEVRLADISKKDQPTELRERSNISDSNEYLLDTLQLAVLKDMDKIDEQTFNEAISSPDKAIEVLHTFRNGEKLNREEVADFENRLTEKMLASDMLPNIPPKLLGQKYQELREKIEAAPQDADVSKEREMLERVEKRIDLLCSNLEKKEDLWFADVTNVSDTYDGYMIMFNAREQGLKDTPEDQQKHSTIETGRNYLNGLIATYDSDWNLNSEDLNKKVEQRFEPLSKGLESVNVSDETMQLVSNFKFTNEQGQIEPQFQLADGTLSDTWQQGAKIIPESKLDNLISVAKQNVLMRELGSDTEITPDNLQKGLDEELPSTLFSIHVSDRVVNNALERPDEFTNKAHLQQFVRQLSNPERPMRVSPLGYEAGIDNCVNSVGGYAHRLAKRLTPDSPIPARLFEPLQKLDKRAKDRTVEIKPSLRELRKNELIGMGKLGLSAVLVSGAITAFGTMAATDAVATTATGGLNKLAGAALGVGLSVGMTALTIHNWRKHRKEQGLPCGFKAMVKDPMLLAAITTTALGATALGFAATGNPGVAAYLGYASLAIGGGSSAVSSYIKNTKAGMSKREAVGWAIGRAGVTALATWAGKLLANTAINAYNHHNPDNTIFQHGETHEKPVITYDTETDWGKLDQNAKEFLSNNWYKDHPELLQQRVEALQAAGVDNPHHMLLTAHDSGMRAPDNMAMYDGGTSNGYHTVFGEGFAKQHNVPYDSIQDMKMLFNGDGTINTDAITAYEGLKNHVGMNNFVSTIDNRPVNDVLYPERHSTYDHNQDQFPTRTTEHPGTVKETILVPNKTDLGYGMLGVLTLPLKAAKKVKERVGSFMDKILKKEPKPIPPKPIPPKPIPPIPELREEYQIVYGTEPNQKRYEEYYARVEAERKAEAPNMPMQDYLQKRLEKFDETVMKKMECSFKAADKEKGKDYKKELENYNEKKTNRFRHEAKIVTECRQSLMESNLTYHAWNNQVTLTHFGKYADHYIAHDEVVSDGSRAQDLNPVLKDKYKKENSKVVITNLDQFLIEGLPLGIEDQFSSKKTCQKRYNGREARERLLRKDRKDFGLNAKGRADSVRAKLNKTNGTDNSTEQKAKPQPTTANKQQSKMLPKTQGGRQ